MIDFITEEKPLFNVKMHSRQIFLEPNFATCKLTGQISIFSAFHFSTDIRYSNIKQVVNIKPNINEARWQNVSSLVWVYFTNTVRSSVTNKMKAFHKYVELLLFCPAYSLTSFSQWRAIVLAVTLQAACETAAHRSLCSAAWALLEIRWQNHLHFLWFYFGSWLEGNSNK